MAAIYKYQLDIVDRQTIDVPAVRSVLSVENQGGEICLWVLVEPDTAPVRKLVVDIVGTGNRFPDDVEPSSFVGSVFAGPFVWHVFARVA